MSEENARVQIRRRLEERYQKRQEVLMHGSIYVFVNTILWGGALILSANPSWLGPDFAEVTPYILSFPILTTLGWGIGLFAHIMDYYFKHGPGFDHRERYIQQEIERELAKEQWRKRKNEERDAYSNSDEVWTLEESLLREAED